MKDIFSILLNVCVILLSLLLIGIRLVFIRPILLLIAHRHTDIQQSRSNKKDSL